MANRTVLLAQLKLAKAEKIERAAKLACVLRIAETTAAIRTEKLARILKESLDWGRAFSQAVPRLFSAGEAVVKPIAGALATKGRMATQAAGESLSNAGSFVRGVSGAAPGKAVSSARQGLRGAAAEAKAPATIGERVAPGSARAKMLERQGVKMRRVPKENPNGQPYAFEGGVAPQVSAPRWSPSAGYASAAQAARAAQPQAAAFAAGRRLQPGLASAAKGLGVIGGAGAAGTALGLGTVSAMGPDQAQQEQWRAQEVAQEAEAKKRQLADRKRAKGWKQDAEVAANTNAYGQAAPVQGDSEAQPPALASGPRGSEKRNADYGLEKLSAEQLRRVKLAARIINADVGLDAIIAHIKAAKSKKAAGVPAAA